MKYFIAWNTLPEIFEKLISLINNNSKKAKHLQKDAKKVAENLRTSNENFYMKNLKHKGQKRKIF